MRKLNKLINKNKTLWYFIYETFRYFIFKLIQSTHDAAMILINLLKTLDFLYLQVNYRSLLQVYYSVLDWRWNIEMLHK
jgi:hypothetical protein